MHRQEEGRHTRLYDRLDRHHKLTPQTETTVVLARAGAQTLDARRGRRQGYVAKVRHHLPEWRLKALRGCGATPSTAMKSSATGPTPPPPTAPPGWRTTGATSWRHIDSAGRLLVPFYTYVYFVDHAQQNLHAVDLDLALLPAITWTCASPRLSSFGSPPVDTRGHGADAASSLHERLNDFQFKGQEATVLAAPKVLAPREALWAATDAGDKAPFDGIVEAGHRVDAEDARTQGQGRVRPSRYPGTCGRRRQRRCHDGGERQRPARPARTSGASSTRVGPQGRTFTGTWFSTPSTHAAHPRPRRPSGRVDLLLRTETVGRPPEVGGAGGRGTREYPTACAMSTAARRRRRGAAAAPAPSSRSLCPPPRAATRRTPRGVRPARRTGGMWHVAIRSRTNVTTPAARSAKSTNSCRASLNSWAASRCRRHVLDVAVPRARDPEGLQAPLRPRRQEQLLAVPEAHDLVAACRA